MARKARVEQKPALGQLILGKLNNSELTQKWLSAQVHVSRQHICNIISGRDNPSIKTILDIADCLGIDKAEILTVFVHQEPR